MAKSLTQLEARMYQIAGISVAEDAAEQLKKDSSGSQLENMRQATKKALREQELEELGLKLIGIKSG